MAQEVSTKSADVVAVIKDAVGRMSAQFSDSLPPHVPLGRFVRFATSASMTEDMMKVCSTPGGRKSLFDAWLKAAGDGLMLDGREAAIYKVNVKLKGRDGEKDKYEARVLYNPMVAGVLKKARNSGEISSIVCQAVYANDAFEIDFVSTEAPIKHRPHLTDRGALVGFYAVTRFKDMTWSQPEYMSVPEVNAVRARSRAKDSGPWVTDFPEMGRKTVLRRHSKYLPSSTDRETSVVDMMQRDDGVYEAQEDEERIEDEPVQAKLSTPYQARKQAGGAKAALDARSADDGDGRPEPPPIDVTADAGPSYDPETGEVYAQPADANADI